MHREESERRTCGLVVAGRRVLVRDQRRPGDLAPRPGPSPATPDKIRPARRWPHRRRRPAEEAAGDRIVIGGPTAPDGRTEVACDLPVGERLQNVASRLDGAGMCVMSSIEMGARYANLEALRGIRDWAARQPGGGYPEKIDRQIKQFCAQKHMNTPLYLQYEGKDPSILRAALRGGRMAAVTYGGNDGVRYRGPIAHMVCLVAYDRASDWAALLDNNAIGAHDLMWMKLADFQRRWLGSSGGWAFVWLAPPPPPVPTN